MRNHQFIKYNGSDESFSRRDMLKLGAPGAAAALLPLGYSKKAHAFTPTFAPFTKKLTIPGKLNTTPLYPAPASPDAQLGSKAVYHGIAPEFMNPPCPDWALYPLKTYQITMKNAMGEIIPGRQTEGFGYNGQTPGPTIVARFREPVVVRMTNYLTSRDSSGREHGVEASVHLHGGHSPAHADGNPNFYVLPGKSRDYYYPNIVPRVTEGCGYAFDESEVPSTMWYHDHTMDITGFNSGRGLAGFYLLTDKLEDDLIKYGVLPPIAGNFDIPLAITDQKFNPDFSLFFDLFDHNGRLGDVFTVNGKAQPYFNVQRRKYRFRILNASSARIYHLRLSSGQPFLVIGTDSWLLPYPIEVKDFQLAMAQRHDVIIDFRYAPNEVFLQNIMVQTEGRGPDGIDRNSPVGLVKFIVAGPPVTNDLTINVNTKLRPHVAIKAADIVATRRWKLERGNGAWQINGRFFSPRRADAVPCLGKAESWIIENGSGGWWHPTHIHLEAHQVQSINGRLPSELRRFNVDTTALPGNTEAKVFMKFRTFTGPFVFHCHNMEHEDMRMMGCFDPRPQGERSPLDGTHEVDPRVSGVPVEPPELYFDAVGDVDRLEGRGVGIPSTDFRPGGGGLPSCP